METTTDKTRDGMPRRKTPEKAKDSAEAQKTPLVTPEPGADDRGPSKETATVLGPDGEAAAQDAEGIWADLPTRIGEFVRREPMTAAVASLGLGLVVGAILGAVLARD